MSQSPPRADPWVGITSIGSARVEIGENNLLSPFLVAVAITQCAEASQTRSRDIAASIQSVCRASPRSIGKPSLGHMVRMSIMINSASGGFDPFRLPDQLYRVAKQRQSTGAFTMRLRCDNLHFYGPPSVADVCAFLHSAFLFGFCRFRPAQVAQTRHRPSCLDSHTSHILLMSIEYTHEKMRGAVFILMRRQGVLYSYS